MTARDLEKSLSFEAIVKIIAMVAFRLTYKHILANVCYICRCMRFTKVSNSLNDLHHC